MKLNRILGGVDKVIKVSWFRTIYFNLHYLPIKQAIKMPILLFGASLETLSGKVVLHGKIRFGMVQLGYDQIPLFKKGNSIRLGIGNNAILEFTDKCIIGSQSALSVGGILKFGSNFSATLGLNIVCWESVSFGADCMIGWNNLFMDSSQHCLKRIQDNQKVSKPTKPILIGDNCWITSNCIFLPGSVIPNKCIVSAGSVVNTNFSNEDEGTIFSGNLASSLCKGFWIDKNDCAF